MTDFYQVGGSLKPDGSSYCMRPADEDIYKALIRGEFCYVLNSRQMGKSSLWIQTQQRLTKQGIKCAYIDLTSIGRKISQDNWYRVLFYELVTSLNLSIDKSWWDQQENLPPVQRLTKFVEDIVYEETENNIVICFDEIDTVISLDFSSDDFFAWIRNCYNKRANAPIRKRKIYEGLTFCILGVADAHSLIRDNIHTPFDIGQPINLDGFIKGQAQPLIQGLIGKVPNPQEVLEEILEWTGGQPFLTQKICKLIFESRTGSNSPSAETEINIRDFIQSRIINNWELQDNPEHLKSIRNRLLHKKSVAQRMLKLYQRILHEGAIPYSSTPDQIQLRLTGLVRQEGQTLKVYNKIYRKVFDEIWVERELDKIPPYIEKYEKYEKSRQQSEKILLSGAKLKEGLLWSKGKSLSESERKFLDLSKKKERKQVRLKANAILESAFLNDHRGRLIDEIGKWTNNQLNLTKIICDLAVKDKNNFREGQEKQFIKQLIQKYIIENWQQNEARDYLIEIQDQILEQDGHAKSRLEIYKDILQGQVIANNKPETSALLKSELIVDKNSGLEVANEIFKKVFNLEWVNQNLKKQGEAYKIAERILKSKFEENQRAILIDEILAWTKNQLDLTRIISNLVLQYEDFLKQGGEKKFIEELIRKNIIENWQQNEARDYLIEIQDQILEQDGHAKSRLKIYKDILQGQVIANNKPETSALLKSELIVDKNSGLEVANEIFKKVFNLEWVNQNLKKQGEAYKIAERILKSKFEENQRTILIDEILAWTNNQLDLTRIISNLVLQYEDCLKQGEEKKFIEQLIRKTIIENWQQNEAKDYLMKIQNQILKQDGHAKSRLLEIYKDILQGQVIANNKPETSALLKSKLVIKNEGYLEVANRIYSEIFNLQWVNQELEKMRVVDNQSKLWGKNSSLSVLVVILAICGAIPLILSLLLFKSNIPNICTERNLSISLEKNIEKLNDLKNNESNKFPSKCETQLKELKLIDKAIKLARNNYVANIPNEDDAFEILCKIPESSSNLNYAKFWVNRWRRDDYWKPEIDQALKDNPECKKLIIIYEEIG